MAIQPQHGDGKLNLLYKIAQNTYDSSQGGGGAVNSVAGKTGDVTLVPTDIVGLQSALDGKATAAQGAKADTALQGNAPAVIDINSTSPALRVTQTGEGHALVVENETHPDQTPMFIDKFGRINCWSTDTAIQLSTISGTHNRTNIEFQCESGTQRLWVLGLDPNAINDTNLVVRRIDSDPTAPIVFNLRQTGNHDANDNWLFTGNVAISGSFTASAIATAITSAAAPATSGSVGSAGSIRYDADYIYICTATDTWRRTAITSW